MDCRASRETCHDLSLPDLSEERAERLVHLLRWPQGTACPACQSRAISSKSMAYQCEVCQTAFNVTKGTFLDGTSLTLAKWIQVMVYACARSDGVTPASLMRDVHLSTSEAHDAFERLKPVAFKTGLVRNALDGGLHLQGFCWQSTLAGLLTTPDTRAPATPLEVCTPEGLQPAPMIHLDSIGWAGRA